MTEHKQYVCHSCGYVMRWEQAQCFNCNCDHFFEVPTNVYTPAGVNPKTHHTQLRTRLEEHCKTFRENPEQKFILSPEDAAYLYRFRPNGFWYWLVKFKCLTLWQIFIVGNDGVSV